MCVFMSILTEKCWIICPVKSEEWQKSCLASCPDEKGEGDTRIHRCVQKGLCPETLDGIPRMRNMTVTLWGNSVDGGDRHNNNEQVPYLDVTHCHHCRYISFGEYISCTRPYVEY